MAGQPAGIARNRALPRFLVAAVVVALLYIGLQELWLAIAQWAVRQDNTPQFVLTGPDSDAEARRVAEASAAREAHLTPGHRRAAFELGANLGYVDTSLSVFGSQQPDLLAQARAELQSQVSKVQSQAEFLGLPAVTVRPIAGGRDRLRLEAIIEADPDGIAARIEAGQSLRHRHLYLAGMHAGATLAQIDMADAMQLDELPSPSLRIARHASAAGVDRSAWMGLLVVPRSAPQVAAQRYRQAIDTLARQLEDEQTIVAR